MSRIGKLPITIPGNVDINYNDAEITVKGKFGTLSTTLPDVIVLSQVRSGSGQVFDHWVELRDRSGTRADGSSQTPVGNGSARRKFVHR